MLKGTMTASILSLIGFLLLVQRPASAAPAFDSASVKPANPELGVRGGCHGIDSRERPELGPALQAVSAPLGACVITDGRLAHFVMIAWNIHGTQYIRSDAEWIARGEERYTIEAKAENPQTATEAQLLDMLQALLIERFQIKFHRETMQEPGALLRVSDKGSKLQPSLAERSSVEIGAGRPTASGPASISGRKFTTERLAILLTGVTRGPVVDKTGLSGAYDFKLSWDEAAGRALSTALEDQLGLRLEAQKVPISLFVIDSAQKPAIK